jgi:outer membrane protein assembly factor BamE (lipoprotein component of BamABCDE complex)
MFKLNFLLSALVLLLACSQSNELDQFNSDAWIADTNGCNNTRAALIQPLLDNKAALEGLGQEAIKDILGSPDRHELYSRNKKAFIYYVSPSPDCGSESASDQRLIIRFDGIGRAKEFVYYN